MEPSFYLPRVFLVLSLAIGRIARKLVVPTFGEIERIIVVLWVFFLHKNFDILIKNFLTELIFLYQPGLLLP